MKTAEENLLEFTIDDECRIVKFVKNEYGDELEKDLRAAWEHTGFSGMDFGNMLEYEKGKLNGFVIGFVRAWTQLKG